MSIEKHFGGISEASIEPLGDAAAIVVWTGNDDDRIAAQVRGLEGSIRDNWSAGFISLVPAFDSLTVHYDPLQLSWTTAKELIEAALCRVVVRPQETPRLREIPVCYDVEFGFDLPQVAAMHQLTASEVIQLHSGATYTVRMIGFSPGFPYLSGLPEQLATPRRSSPRLKVPAGSVAIGGRQTGIYSQESPGGWHIIGRTSIQLFCVDREPPCLLLPGDQLRFLPVSREEFLISNSTK